MENKHFECKKVKYSTEQFAVNDIERIRKKSNREIIPTRAYFCFCGSWHLTSKIDKKDIVISKLMVEISELKLKIDELSKIHKKELYELDKQERYELRKNRMLEELKKVLKSTQKNNKSIRKTNADLIHKNIMLQKELDLIKSSKNK
jgi:hypothetical protein